MIKAAISKVERKGTFQVSHRQLLSTHAEAHFIGSQANQAILLSTSIFLIAGRAGLAPSTSKPADASLKLRPMNSGLEKRDPAGFTIVDTMAFGAMGHIVGVGIYLGTVGANLI